MFDGGEHLDLFLKLSSNLKVHDRLKLERHLCCLCIEKSDSTIIGHWSSYCSPFITAQYVLNHQRIMYREETNDVLSVEGMFDLGGNKVGWWRFYNEGLVKKDIKYQCNGITQVEIEYGTSRISNVLIDNTSDVTIDELRKREIEVFGTDNTLTDSMKNLKMS